jgi:hypothetical protein
MKSPLLAGGLSTRISEEIRTKPMIEMGAGLVFGTYLKSNPTDFAPEQERCVAFGDLVIGIEWSLTQQDISSLQPSRKDVPMFSLNNVTTGGL